MKKTNWILSFMLLTASVMSESASEEMTDTEISQILTSELDSFRDSTGLEQGGIAAFVSTPYKEWFASVGIGENIGTDIHFRAASTTKTFTAASIMYLQETGLLNIDDVIVSNIPGTEMSYLPDTPEYDVPFKEMITIRQLLEHRAGVFDISNEVIPDSVDAPYAGLNYIEYVRSVTGDDNHTFTFDEMVGVVASNGLAYWEPGGDFHYSNTGYSMLGKIIERVSGQSYAEFVTSIFLEPLDLASTGFPDLGTDTGIPSPFADGFTLFDGEIYPTTADNMSPHVAEGNVVTTVHDLSRWITLLLSGRAGISVETVSAMMDIQATGEHHVWYGLGITFTSGIGYGHNGAHIGYMTVVRYDPTDSVTVLIFSSFLAPEYFMQQGELLIRIAREAKEICGYSASDAE